MAESHVVSGLVAKRSELSGQIMHHQEAMRQLSAAIGHIDGAIKLFAPEYDLRTIKATAHKQMNPWFKTGESVRCILDALRTAVEPLTTRQVCEAILKAKGIDPLEITDWALFLNTVLAALRRQEKKGIVRIAGMVAGTNGHVSIWQTA